MASVTLSFKVFSSRERAEVLYKSIEPEVKTIRGRRTKVCLTMHSDGVAFELLSADLTAARAAANTLIRLLDTSSRTLEVLGNVR